MKHIVSFLRSPIGYALNLLATLAVHAAALPGMGWIDWVFERTLLGACEALCLRDGVQDDMLF